MLATRSPRDARWSRIRQMAQGVARWRPTPSAYRSTLQSKFSFETFTHITLHSRWFSVVERAPGLTANMEPPYSTAFGGMMSKHRFARWLWLSAKVLFIVLVLIL